MIFIPVDLTFRLLRAASEAENQDLEACEEIVTAIREDHVEAATRHIRSHALRASLITQISELCHALLGILRAVKLLQDLSTKSLDSIISKGEVLSCMFMSAVLRDSGVDAEFVDLSDFVTMRSEAELPSVQNPHGVGQPFYDSIALSIQAKLDACWPRVPVVTGYFGSVPGGLLSAVGRGYTDLCAALNAVGVAAAELQIWKEVDGIYDADPRKVPTAHLLSAITPAEASELTFYGSEVIHPFTMDQVMRKRIPIAIRNVNNPAGSGTKVVPEPFPPPMDGANGDSVQPRRLSYSFRPPSGYGRDGQRVRPKRPTAVTSKRNILVVNVHSNKRSLSYGFLARIFTTLANHKLSADLISTSQVHVSIALHSENALISSAGQAKRVVDRDLQGALDELKAIGDVDLADDMAILSLVGKEMKNMPGIAGRMFSILGDNNVNIYLISQGKPQSILHEKVRLPDST